jgi:hypothetical protein
VNTKGTSTKADSSTHSGTTRRTPRRPSKLKLFRIKVATIVAAVILFLASLTGIAVYNPGVAAQAPAPTPVPAQRITIVKPDGSHSQVVLPPPRVTAPRPFVRSRGS